MDKPTTRTYCDGGNGSYQDIDLGFPGYEPADFHRQVAATKAPRGSPTPARVNTPSVRMVPPMMVLA